MAANNSINAKEEPKSAPKPDQWYNLTLGPSFKDPSSNKYCTLRYDFRPASIDKTKPGVLHKNNENRVSVEFQNNQLGKPKVTFEGSSEDYKEMDAVLFFDGHNLRLERLHRAVKQLRYNRTLGESAAAAASADPRLSPIGKPVKPPPPMHSRASFPAVPVEVERIDVGDPQIPGTKFSGKEINEQPIDLQKVSTSLPIKNDDFEEHQDIDIEDIFGTGSPEDRNTAEQRPDVGFDINMPHQNETDDEIADVDGSGDEGDKQNAAEALKGQGKGEEGDEQSSSSSSSSESGSGSGSSSSSSSGSDSEGSDEDSINSI